MINFAENPGGRRMREGQAPSKEALAKFDACVAPYVGKATVPGAPTPEEAAKLHEMSDAHQAADRDYERLVETVVFVGQGPNQAAWKDAVERGEFNQPMDPQDFAEKFCARIALTGACGKKLAAVLGVTFDEFLRMPRANLNARWNGKLSKGDLFDSLEGFGAATGVVTKRPAFRYVALGLGVAKCLGVRNPEFLRESPSERFSLGAPSTGPRPVRVFVLPHPSGVNRWWNDPKNHTRARRALRKFMKG